MAGPEITIAKAEGGWVVQSLGAIIGESRNALILKEGDYPKVVYIPRADVTMAFLELSDTVTTCPHKGKATYYHFIGKNRTLKDFAWSYEIPDRGVAQIAGHLAFGKDQATVERVN
ncbi:MAG: DUF427 domain-containing protein [Rhodobacteraceae bacterium]|nr:DUF427 domain-containing protein [Paracoccaceae bacterium]